MATVNQWDADAKLEWCLARRAQKAFQRLPKEARDTYNHVKTTLTTKQ